MSFANLHHLLIFSLSFSSKAFWLAALQDSAGIVRKNLKTQNKTWRLPALRPKPDTARSPFSSQQVVYLGIFKSLFCLVFKRYDDTLNRGK